MAKIAEIKKKYKDEWVLAEVLAEGCVWTANRGRTDSAQQEQRCDINSMITDKNILKNRLHELKGMIISAKVFMKYLNRNK